MYKYEGQLEIVVTPIKASVDRVDDVVVVTLLVDEVDEQVVRIELTREMAFDISQKILESYCGRE
jgi:hypothetical protein